MKLLGFFIAFILLFSIVHAVETTCATQEDINNARNIIIKEIDNSREELNTKYYDALTQLNQSKVQMTEQINAEIARKVNDIILVLAGAFVACLCAFMFLMSFMLLRRNDIFEERLDRELYADLKDIREIRYEANKHRISDEDKKPDNPDELAKKE